MTYNSNFLQTGSSAISRSITNKLQDIISVKDFGAVGDGVTDDTNAIQAAVTAALTAITRSGRGGTAYSTQTLHFPPGTYLITSTINITQPVAQTNYPDQAKIIFNGGPGAILLGGASFSSYMFYFQNIRVECSDLFIIGNVAGTSSFAKLGVETTLNTIPSPFLPVYDSHFHDIDTYGMNNVFTLGHCFDTTFSDITSFSHFGTNPTWMNVLPHAVDNCNNLKFTRIHAEAITAGGTFIYARSNLGTTEQYHNIWTFDTCHFETHTFGARALDLQGVQTPVFINPAWTRAKNATDGITDASAITLARFDNCFNVDIQDGIVQHIASAGSGSFPSLVEVDTGSRNFKWRGYASPASSLAAPGLTTVLTNNSTDTQLATFDLDLSINDQTHIRFLGPRRITAPDSANRQFLQYVTSQNSQGNNTYRIAFSNDITGAATPTDYIDIDPSTGYMTSPNGFSVGSLADPINYSRGFMRYSAGLFHFGAEFAGTGTPVTGINMDVGGISRWQWNNGGRFQPLADNSYSIGNNSNRIQELFRGGVECESGASSSSPTTGTTITVGSTTPTVIATPSGSLAALTFQLPTPIGDGHQIVFIISQAITTLTITPNAGASVLGAPTTTSGYSTFKLRYVASTTTWMFSI